MPDMCYRCNALWFACSLLFGILFPLKGADVTLLNASYDPTRELYREFNAAFVRHWFSETGQRVQIRQSHGGSAKQARSVMEGLRADVVTLALAYDIDVIALKGGMLPTNWQERLPHKSAPYTSTVLFLVRKGNPMRIHDWPDLLRPGVKVVTANPRTSGGARWNYLAAWGYALKTYGSEDRAFEFVEKLFSHVPTLEAGTRAAATTFIHRGIGEVLITWESEALLALKESGARELEMIRPSMSILTEPAVAWLDRNTRRKGTTDVARAYLSYLYSAEGQAIIARHGFRPSVSDDGKPGGASAEGLFTIDEVFGGWQEAQRLHFVEGGTFDKIQRRLH